MTTNQNASQIQQMLRELEIKVDHIPLMLTTFDTRVSKLEQRLDKVEEMQREEAQRNNNEHTGLREAMHTAKDEIVRDVGIKIDGLRTKIDESTTKTWEQRVGHLFATFGWIVAIGLFILGYVLSHR